MKGTSQDMLHQQLEKLREAFPEVISEQGIDWEKLKLTLGDDIALTNERYVLNWAGKSEAFRAIQAQTTATLKPQREQSVDFDATQNIFIEGENLEVLKVLQKSYYGKVKMIYIDPPYNTGNDSFIYPDKFSESKDEYLKRIGDKDEAGYLTKEGFFRKNSKENGQFHSNWLSMMYPRLFLARNLLRDDGVIFVSIDDNEVHNLRLVMNEIFGEENFVAQIVWKKKHSYGRGQEFIIPQTEFILCYAKSIVKANDFGIKYSDDKAEQFDQEDGKGRYRLLRLWHTSPQGAYERKTLQYLLHTPKGDVVDSVTGQWLWSEDRMKAEIQADNVVFVEQRDGTIRAFKKDHLSEDRREKPTSLYDKVTTDDATKEFNSILPDVKETFFTKPSQLILDLISWVTSEDENANDIIFDFFAGSGTTAQAVLELNKVDGGNRKFVLGQLPEKTEKDSEAFKAGFKTISDISRERIRRVGSALKKEIEDQPDLFKDKPLDLGFKVFTLEPSNFKIWRTDVIETEEELKKQMEIFVDPVRVRSEADDPASVGAGMAWEILLKSGFELTTPLEKLEIGGAPVYSIAGGEVMLLLEAVTQEAIDALVGRDSRPDQSGRRPDQRPKHVICLDRLFQGNDQLKTNTVLQMKDAGVEFRTI